MITVMTSGLNYRSGAIICSPNFPFVVVPDIITNQNPEVPLTLKGAHAMKNE